jgi:hypothetical protein
MMESNMSDDMAPIGACKSEPDVTYGLQPGPSLTGLDQYYGSSAFHCADVVANGVSTNNFGRFGSIGELYHGRQSYRRPSCIDSLLTSPLTSQASPSPNLDHYAYPQGSLLASNALAPRTAWDGSGDLKWPQVHELPNHQQCADMSTLYSFPGAFASQTAMEPLEYTYDTVDYSRQPFNGLSGNMSTAASPCATTSSVDTPGLQLDESDTAIGVMGTVDAQQRENAENTASSAADTSSNAASDKRNSLAYAQLIHRAFMSTPGHAMTLQQIYQWFRDNTDKAKLGGKGWQNSIRHNLSMNQVR